MKLRIDELRAAATLVLDRLEQTAGAEIDVNADYYWDVPIRFRYDVYNEPSELTIGQLSDDLDHVRGIAVGREDPIPYHLVWIASVMAYVGATATAVEGHGSSE